MKSFLRSLPLLLGLLAPAPAGANVIAALESHGIDVITRARCGDSRHNVGTSVRALLAFYSYSPISNNG